MLKLTETIKLAALAILKNVAVKVIKFRLLGKGQTPWAYYQDKKGKRRSTFIKKSAFNGYDWNKDYSQVINLQTGDTYQVTSHSCTCKDWYYRVRTGQKSKCKHQIMRHSVISHQSSVNSNNLTQLTEEFEQNNTKKLVTDDYSLVTEIEDLPIGCFTRKYENNKSVEHRLFAWVRKFNGEEYYPEIEEIGKILVSSFNGLEAWTKTAINGITFESINDAISYLLRKANINLKETEQAYQYINS